MTAGYKILPHINFEGIDYTIDLRLGEFRDTKQPFISVKFDSPRGRTICELTGIVKCLDCRKWVMIPGTIRQDNR
jgi:hypothetical protein